MTYSHSKLTRYDSLFEDFLVNIALTRTQSSLIDETLSEAIGLFITHYNDLDVYVQGSYAMGTIVKPLTANQSKNGVAGEYDIDIVLERSEWESPTQSLTGIREVLLDEYAQKVDDKERESCERVYHSKDSNTEVKFHADYVPILLKYNVLRYVTKRSDDSWFRSDTKELKDWFLEYVSDKPFIQGLIVILKRIRDVAELTDELPSICITSIVCEYYEQSESYAEDLIAILDRIVSIFSQPYSDIHIKLPTTNEDLARKIKSADCNRIRIAFQSCLSMLRNEFLLKDNPDLKNVQKHLSDDFPASLENYPECLEALRRRDIGIELDGSLKKVAISEVAKKADLIEKAAWYKFIGKGKPLQFVASDYDKAKYGIRWQVLNAKGSADRRGSLFKGKGKSGAENSNEFMNYETERYDGVHWIKYFIFEKQSRKVVEIGKKFYVEVKN